MKICRAKSRRCARGGNTLIELTLVMPVLLMLAFGVVEYSYFIYIKGRVQDSARAGARAAIVSDATNTTVQNAVATSMTSYGLQGSGYTVTLSPSNMQGLPTGQQITVSVSCSWGVVGMHVLPSSLGGISNSKTVNGSLSVNRE